MAASPIKMALGEDYEVIDWALEVTGTEEFKYRPVDALSGGQRRRAWIAMALAPETDVYHIQFNQRSIKKWQNVYSHSYCYSYLY